MKIMKINIWNCQSDLYYSMRWLSLILKSIIFILQKKNKNIVRSNRAHLQTILLDEQNQIIYVTYSIYMCQSIVVNIQMEEFYLKSINVDMFFFSHTISILLANRLYGFSINKYNNNQTLSSKLQIFSKFASVLIFSNFRSNLEPL